MSAEGRLRCWGRDRRRSRWPLRALVLLGGVAAARVIRSRRLVVEPRAVSSGHDVSARLDGRDEEACRRRARAGHLDAMSDLGVLLAGRGQVGEAEELLARAA